MSTKLTRTNSGGSSGTKWTRSLWVKRGALGASQSLCAAGSYITFTSTDYIEVLVSAGVGMLVTNRKFRDPSAWYHIVLTYDSTAGSSDRLILYVNGVRETSFSTNTQPALNQVDTATNNGQVQYIATRTGSNYYFLGNMAHVYFTDGYVYPASSFGETDSTSGIWKPKLSASVSYGTNGYFLKFVSGATGTDSSGQTNNFTVAGNLTSPNDNPQNNYCKMNPLDSKFSAPTLTNCNTTIATSAATWSTATQWLQSGLWYWEIQPTGSLGGGECLGFLANISRGASENPYNNAANVGAVVRSGGNVYINSSDTGNISPSGDLWASGDVIGIYMDLNANKVYFAKNGTILNSGTGKTITAADATWCYSYSPIWGSSNTSASTANFNFGEGYLGTTALTGTTYADSNSEGKFKYSPNNSGGSSFDGAAKNFLAICTNNIATDS